MGERWCQNQFECLNTPIYLPNNLSSQCTKVKYVSKIHMQFVFPRFLLLYVQIFGRHFKASSQAQASSQASSLHFATLSRKNIIWSTNISGAGNLARLIRIRFTVNLILKQGIAQFGRAMTTPPTH